MLFEYLLIIPFIGPVLGAVLTWLIGHWSAKGRDIAAIAVTAAQLALVTALLVFYASGHEARLALDGVLGLGLTFELSGFGLIFAFMTSYMWLMTTLFAQDYLSRSHARSRYDFFLLVTLGATAGVFLSGDLYTTFVCFEIMSMASYVCVVHEETAGAMRAGGVYLAVATIGGLVTLMGIFLLYHLTGTLAFDGLLPVCQTLFAESPVWFYIAGGCILFGFGAKAGMYPLHIWLPMAHPVAPAPASALLSGIITKTGIFGVVVISTRIFLNDGYWGFVILAFGVVTAFMGGLLAVFSVDFKRTLACSSMSQLGFILIGIGMLNLLGTGENALAVRGTILHMLNHSNLKLVLFMAAGVVLMNLHNGDLNNIRGFGRKKPALLYAFLMGALGISGIPLFNGYVSKTLIHESIVEYMELLEEGEGALTFAFASGEGAVILFKVIEWLFLITGGMTLAYMTKLFVLLFIEKNNDPSRQASYEANTHYCTKLTAAVLVISATVLPILGCLPYATQNKIADFGQGFLFGTSPEHAVNYFSLTNLQGGLISITIGVLIYVFVIRGWMMEKKPAVDVAGPDAKGASDPCIDLKNAPEPGSEGGKEETRAFVTVYVNRWPQRLDLLTLLYEPLVIKILPAVGAFFCRILDGLLEFLVLKVLIPVGAFGCHCLDVVWEAFVLRVLIPVGTLFSRCLEYVTDLIVLLCRKTTHRQLKEKPHPPVHFKTSYYIGRLCNAIAGILNRTLLRARPIETDFVERLTLWQRGESTFVSVIAASSSFGFFMLAVGMIILAVVLFLL